MDKHHSKVQLVSELGVGTTFWFDLPVFEQNIVSQESQLVDVTQL